MFQASQVPMPKTLKEMRARIVELEGAITLLVSNASRRGHWETTSVDLRNEVERVMGWPKS